MSTFVLSTIKKVDKDLCSVEANSSLLQPVSHPLDEGEEVSTRMELHGQVKV
jgi:hypothetical protein